MVIATGYNEILLPPSAEELEQQGVKSLLVIGSGLSAIDLWRQYKDNSDIKITFLSRHGLLPLQNQLSTAKPLNFEALVSKSPRQIVSYLRKLKQSGSDWQNIADSLRPQVSNIWKSWSQKQRSQFIRHLKTYWEIIRHRIPEVICEDLTQDLKTHKLIVKSGRISEIKKLNDKFQVSYENKNSTQPVSEVYDHFMNVTGYQINQSLIKAGDIPGVSVCSEGLGYQCDSTLNVWVAGPASKSNLWEITAVPEIRRQAALIAEGLYQLQ